MNIFGVHEVSEGSVEQVSQMIERVFEKRGLSPHDHQVDPNQIGAWWLTEGKSTLYIYVDDTNSGPMLRITSPILNLPASNLEKFYRRLLDLNADLNVCSVATYQNTVVIVAQRHTAWLAEQELDEIISTVAYVADTVESKLIAEFGATAYK